MDRLDSVIYQLPMGGKNRAAAATDESGSIPLTQQGTRAAGKVRRREYLKARRDLTEADLANPAVQQLMIAEIERLEGEITQLKATALKYADLRVDYASLSTSTQTSRWSEILSAVCLMAGSAGLGAAPGYLTADGFHGVGWIIAVVSALLIIVGAVSRIFR